MFIISKVTSSEVFFLHTPLSNHGWSTFLMRAGIQPLSLHHSHHQCNCCQNSKFKIVSKSTSNNCPFWVMLISGKQILLTSELFAMRSKSLKRMNGFFVSNYDWEVSFKLSLSVIFPMTPTHLSIWSYFLDHNDIDKILPKAQRPKPMFRVGNQNWLRTPACLAAYLFLGLCFFIFVERHQLFENLEKEPSLVEDAGMPGSLAISWTIDFIFVEKTSTNLVKSKAHLGKFLNATNKQW